MADINVHPERFDPAESAGTLMDAEHRCRYWWAAQVVKGKDVLDAACGTGYGTLMLAEAGAESVVGVDASADAVDVARERLGEHGEILQADLAKVPLEDDSFDLVVCMETIEHLSDGSAAIAEFRRVLRPDGLLLVSSPNPGVYPEGNEHHVHEYSADELKELVGATFPSVVEYVQHPWIASGISADDHETEADWPAPELMEIAAPTAGSQTYTILAAAASDPPHLAARVTLGESFEIGWWSDQLEGERSRLQDAQRKQDRVDGQLASAEEQLEKARAQAAETEQYLTRELTASLEREQAAGKQLNEANGRVVRASEEIGRLQALEKHYGELRKRSEELGIHYDVAVTRLREIEASRLSKLAAILRRVRARF
jgi:ubiquinone/menaquinone biosynthesis C-methylase UbiE